MASRENRRKPAGDLPMLHRGLYDYQIYEKDLERVNKYRNAIEEFYLNYVLKEGIEIAQQRTITAKERVKLIEEL